MSRFGRHLKTRMLGFPEQILPMMGFSSCDNSDIFQWLKLVSIGGSCSEPFSHLHQPPRVVEDTGAGLLQLLVAGHLPLCCQLCGRVQCLQPLQVLPDTEGGEAYPKPDPNPPLGSYLC